MLTCNVSFADGGEAYDPEQGIVLEDGNSDDENDEEFQHRDEGNWVGLYSNVNLHRKVILRQVVFLCFSWLVKKLSYRSGVMTRIYNFSQNKW